METLSGHVLVVGLGASGSAVAEYLSARVAGGDSLRVTAVDSADTPKLRATAAALTEAGVQVFLGTSNLSGTYDLAIVSPGVPPHVPLMTSVRGVTRHVVGELEFAFNVSASPWIAITGTNGKTTTTTLVAHLLGYAGIAAELAGNIGHPAIEVAAKTGPGTAIVAEVSSFQLSLTKEFHPRVSVLLNITPDHIDWHGSMEAYVGDKARIFENQDADDSAVIDADDAGSAPFAGKIAAQGVRVVPISMDRLLPGGAGLVGEMLVLDTGSAPVNLVTREDLAIRGEHNVSNALAAAATAYLFGADIEAIREGLMTFEPIEHRLEPAGEAGGVEYFNDSKATNPDAVTKALTAFPEREIVLLLGGRNKGNDFSSLAADVCSRCKAVVTFGEAGPEIGAALEQAGCPSVSSRSLAEAVGVARNLAEPTDVVLLSPACASFDEFEDFADRGRAFKRLVGELSREVTLGGA